jgi:hypothetical protein
MPLTSIPAKRVPAPLVDVIFAWAKRGHTREYRHKKSSVKPNPGTENVLVTRDAISKRTELHLHPGGFDSGHLESLVSR